MLYNHKINTSMRFKLGISIGLFLVSTAFSFAQEDKEEQGDIDTERLIIVKPYSPTVSDAFKIKQNPVINDSTERQKKKVNYTINSFPVASTFTPAKGRAARVQQQALPASFDNYASLGVGNYFNVDAAFFGRIPLSRYQDLNLSFTHQSTQGGIDGVALDDEFYDTQLKLGYEQETRSFTWGTQINALHQSFNWYGLPQEFSIPEPLLDGIETGHAYLGGGLDAYLNTGEGVFQAIDLSYMRFADNWGAGENRLVLSPKFELPLTQLPVDLELKFDYVNGNFDEQPNNVSFMPKYAYLNSSISPRIVLSDQDYSVQLGAELVYSMDVENEKNNFYIYPKVSGSYRLAGDYFTVYGGAQGGLKQNSYHGFTQNNPFVAPALVVAPTDKQYDVFVGGKGKFTEALSYNVKASYQNEVNKALFKHSTDNQNVSPREGYEYFNSFGVVYDEVNTLQLFAELQLDINDQFNLKVNGSFYSYGEDKEPEAWNLPQFESQLMLNYAIDQKWLISASMLAMGERKDSLFIINSTPESSAQTQTLDAFVDANLRVDYQFTEQWGFFLRGNNLLGDNYERWYAYPTQGLQIMAGATYQFDW
jgi:hypothetical protein